MGSSGVLEQAQESSGKRLPKYVENEFRRYLECGLHAHGFARAVCETCGDIAVALLVAATIATMVGFAFPFLLARLGRDPALGSGPLATVVQDVLSLVAYFVAVQWLAR